MNALISTHTPNLMSHETLEAMFVQRHALAGRIVELIRASAAGGSKHHTLLIGPRGIGKTHMVSLVYHRVRAADDLREPPLIAWLREEEWGISAFRDLLMRILLTLADERGDADLRRRAEALYARDPDAVERLAGNLLRDCVAGRTLLLMVENLDDMFAGLGEEGQQRLRAYIQENPFFTILATARGLFPGIRRAMPFYGFFRTHHLEPLTFQEAVELLGKIAKLDGDARLASLLRTPAGRVRVRPVHHLAGGNHRVYVIFSQLLTCEALDDLVDAVMEMIDKLTPYYQSRMMQLSPQQRRIVEFLCERGEGAAVKEIARRCFATSQAVSGTLRDLREMGYVRSTPVGRQSHCELREPLMRICIEVKKQRGRPVRFLVELLRLWYSREELEHRAAGLPPGAAQRARALLGRGASKGMAGDTQGAIADYSALIDMPDAPSDDKGPALFFLAARLVESGRWEEALSALREGLSRFRGAESAAYLAEADILAQLMRSDVPYGETTGRLAALLRVHDDCEQMPPLIGTFLTGLTGALRTRSVNTDRLGQWVRAWREVAGEREDFRAVLRIADAAVRYRAEEDERILLELPAEERKIVRQMLGLEDADGQPIEEDSGGESG